MSNDAYIRIVAVAVGILLAFIQNTFDILNLAGISHPDFSPIGTTLSFLVGFLIAATLWSSSFFKRQYFFLIAVTVFLSFLTCISCRFIMETYLFPDKSYFLALYYVWYGAILAFSVFFSMLLGIIVIYSGRNFSFSHRPSEYAALRGVHDLEDGKPIFYDLVFLAPRQGVAERFSSTDRLTDWLEAAKQLWKELAADANEAKLPKLYAHCSYLASIVEKVEDQVYRKSYTLLKAYERACKEEKIALPGGNVGYIFDRSIPIRHRAFAAATFVNAESLDPSLTVNLADLPTPASILSEEFNAAYPDFRLSGGEAQVLYDMTVRVLGRQAETAQLLDIQVHRIAAYLEAAKIQAQLGPAAARWRRKGQGHVVGAAIALFPFALLILLVIYYRGQIAHFIGTLWTMDFETKASLNTWSDFLAKAPLASAVFISVPALLFAWFLKHCSRLFVHNLTLAAEASNRAAVADVYARMTAQGSVFTPEHQTIVIQSLFRARDNAHETEGIPANALEQILQLLRKPPVH